MSKVLLALLFSVDECQLQVEPSLILFSLLLLYVCCFTFFLNLLVLFHYTYRFGTALGVHMQDRRRRMSMIIVGWGDIQLSRGK